MSPTRRLRARLSRAAHPRLLVLVVVAVVLGVLGTALALAAPVLGAGLRSPGLRIAVVGYLLFLLGASGYVAFAAFERGFDGR